VGPPEGPYSGKFGPATVSVPELLDAIEASAEV
jgi:hypothetical protein